MCCKRCFLLLAALWCPHVLPILPLAVPCGSHTIQPAHPTPRHPNPFQPTYVQVMEEKHNFLHRQVLLLRASAEDLTEDDHTRLRAHAIGPTSLGDGSPGNNRCAG